MKGCKQWIQMFGWINGENNSSSISTPSWTTRLTQFLIISAVCTLLFSWSGGGRNSKKKRLQFFLLSGLAVSNCCMILQCVWQCCAKRHWTCHAQRHVNQLTTCQASWLLFHAHCVELLVVEWICDAPIGNGGCRGGGAFEHPVLVVVPWNILLYPLPSLNVCPSFISVLPCPAYPSWGQGMSYIAFFSATSASHVTFSASFNGNVVWRVFWRCSEGPGWTGHHVHRFGQILLL